MNWNPTDTELAVYNHYLSGSTKGDLYAHAKRGKLGIMKPERSNGHAFAAWKAGQKLAENDI